ncbi:polysaccharide lyase family 8 super-sandwich domain-containing protein [Desertivirga xinjiangensis]|uniref:polysaccharide lyase family 8 super-sandwich domain-containing protein n=1 Tax=Desertivirga xinjiangensis TaxID=539206 RepID=UPI002109B22D|nr:polysaccharide lyase family 8 super-sandwich domain-containing protein [Pedobacter xinjiangensis]
MRQLLLVSLFIIQTYFGLGQQRFVNFNTGIPSNWSTSNGGQISLSNEHVKGGANALKWVPQAGAVLTAGALNIPAADTYNYTANSAQFFVYSSSVSTDTLIFKFYDANNILKREGRMLLNYQGWREFHRSYRYDYDSGSELPGFFLNKMEVVYKPSSSLTNVIFLDEMTFVMNADVRNPGPHMALDIGHFRLTSNYTNAYSAWKNQPDIPFSSVTNYESEAIKGLKISFRRTLSPVSASALASAKSFVNNCAISYNSDGSVRGRGISAIYNIDTLIKLSEYCGALTRAYALNNDADALNKLQLFAAYLLEQGLAEGSRSIIPYNNYSAARVYSVGFLDALPHIADAGTKSAIVKMLKWSHEFNTIYNVDPVPGLEMDYLHVKSNFLVELALLGNSDSEISRDLKSFRRYLEQFTYDSQGARDGIKPDGAGFHHNSQHISYLYAYDTWINRAYELKGTPFKVSLTAYRNMSKALKALFLETSKGAIYPHSASGRSPFPASVPVSATALDRFIQVGSDITQQNAEPEMAGFYNYIFHTNRYAVPALNYDGYHQLNYAQTGIMRKDNWIAVARGFTDRMFGAEIYAGANRYGRYQSYGALEVLYNGSLAASGYVNGGAGWDWNMMPGTTTVMQSYDNLKPLLSGTASEYQADAFAGALANGNTGVFGMNFSENAGARYIGSNLAFRKTVFTFDSLMLCLGSNISSSNALDPVITTLFQSVNSGTNNPIYINSLTATNGGYNQSLSTALNGLWLVNAQTTGYYISQGNGDLNIFRGSQNTPVHMSDNTATTASAIVSKSWLSHGTQPNAATYQFVVVPATTPQKMSALASKIHQNEVFEVLMQTDSIHAVKYIPGNLTSFAAFLPQSDINIGYLKGISGRALLSLKEERDTLIIKIASPDLNAVSNTESTWISSVNQVKVSLSGSWRVSENASGAGIFKDEDLLEANFHLKDGFAQTLILIKDKNSNPASLPLQGKQLIIYPNPVNDELNVTCFSNLDRKSVVLITDISGRILLKENRHLRNGENLMKYSVGDFPAGAYILKVGDGRLKFIKQ